MKTCNNCGKGLTDDAVFCPNCGAPCGPFVPDARETAEERAAINTMDRFLRYERIAWRVSGIVFLVLSVVWIILSALFIVIGGSFSFSYDVTYGYSFPYELTLALGIVYLIIGLVIYLPISIVGFVMTGKTNYYREALYTDVSVARKRCSSVGMIVFGALFNTVAMVFIIINFVKTKNNAAVLDRIAAKQRR